MNGKPTRHSGVFRQDNGQLFVKVTARINGKRVFQRKVLPMGATEAEAIRLVAELKDGLARAGQPQLPPSPLDTTNGELPTFGNYVKKWLESKIEKVRPAVHDEWVHRLAVHCEAVEIFGTPLKEHRIDQVRRMHLEQWVAWAEKVKQPNGKPYSPDTVAGWWRVLTAVLRDAAADYDLPDPIRRVTPPRIKHVAPVRTQETLDLDEVENMVSKAPIVVPDRATEVAFLAYTGCRSGEMYGLHWKDVDLDGGTCALRHSATRGELEHTKPGKPRQIPLHAKLVTLLREHRKLQMLGKVPQSKDGLVFPAETGSYRLEQSLAKPFAALTITIGKKVTPQVLRRSLNTNLLALGIDTITIQSILGHSSDKMTERYAGIAVTSKAKVLSALFG